MAIQNGETSVSQDRIAHALSQVASNGNDFTNGDPEARQKLIQSARELLNAAQTPAESLFWHIWARPTGSVAARIAVDLKLFETVVGDDGSPKSIEQLASVTKASPVLVKRIARTCATMFMLEEKEPARICRWNPLLLRLHAALVCKDACVSEEHQFSEPRGPRGRTFPIR
jgi:hypothetical protein